MDDLHSEYGAFIGAEDSTSGLESEDLEEE
jgi:hypothetical protein